MRNEFGTCRPDLRGHSMSGNKVSDAKHEEVRKHILSFPSMESHYCRNRSTKKYLDASLSIKQMYSLYCESEVEGAPVKESFYRNIFTRDFNLSFHRPKKDYCMFCTKFENANAEEKVALQDEFNAHHQRKEKVRGVKANFKKLVSESTLYAAATFDLQQVMMAPKLNVSSLFYKRKLNTYNLTIYNLKDSSAHCYMWHEGVAGRGSNEIASCVCKWIATLPQETKHIALFSDTCGGQNRNIQMSVALMHVCQTNDHVETISQYMMESGHSQMECDSVHSTIERACKNIPVYTPMDYYMYAIVRTARREAPYTVMVMDGDDFFDYKSLVTQFVRNRNRCENNEQAHWIRMKLLKYNKDCPGTMEFSYNYDAPDHKLTLNRGPRGRRPNIMQLPTNVSKLYTGPIAISKAKYNDLQSLCTSLAIPRDYHSFYKSLAWTTAANKERLPEPDIEEDSEIDG